MCHLFLALPALGLGLFFLLPFPVALPTYLAVAGASIFIYYKITRTMQMPQPTGAASMVGGIGQVKAVLEQGRAVRYLVWYGGELWTAVSRDTLVPGEQVKISAVDGIKLVVEPEPG